ncbi:phosphotransferase [Agarivorans sp. MS3-6]|uniref:ecdysteroid 22-kinase family protein n=1 Tax=Agarivorans sp. TSD2052 TaxID=2937286 RepID=UPI00200D31D3|nr:ecdysteroid 22-kinase family protein [Agarivorans sp. TSD2052]UPW17323.1 ecdysteroid 22-kinase family protein [Agarivorans sp. TSD2052]
MPLTTEQQHKLCQLNQATQLEHCHLIQTLWGGYGELLRIHFNQAIHPSLIVKSISYPREADHPRGWNTPLSHQRKVHSYQVESAWYQHYAKHCDKRCPVPSLIDLNSSPEAQWLVLEDLHNQGFTQVKQHVSYQQALVCIGWLANFHGRFLQSNGQHLWPQGGYWHLATRPDEHTAMANEPLKHAAKAIDQALHNSHYHCLIHGDAKLANFCFNAPATRVAAVDFQYVGKGCGMQDLALFMGSCLSQQQCFDQQDEILDIYFAELQQAIKHYQTSASLTGFDFAVLEQQWRARYPLAWADFQRFLKGWSPGHWKLNDYSEQQTQLALHYLAEQRQ